MKTFVALRNSLFAVFPLLAGGGGIYPFAARGAEAYLESNGANWIETGYVCTPDTVIFIDYELTEGNGSQARLFGGGRDAAGGSLFNHYLNGGLQFAYNCRNGGTGDDGIGRNTSMQKAADTGVRHTFTLDAAARRAVFTTAGETVYDAAFTVAAVTANAAAPLRIFNGVANATPSRARLYRFKIFQGETLVHDWRPCVKDGLAGLLDAETGGFLASATTTPFTCGGDVETRLDPCLESDGASYIDTGYRPTADARIVADFAYLETNNVVQPRIYGSSGLKYVLYLNGANEFAYMAYDGAVAANRDGVVGYNTRTRIFADVGVRHVMDVDVPGQTAALTTGGVTNYSATLKTVFSAASASGNLLVFSSSENQARVSRARLYGLRVYEADRCVRNWIPSVRDNVPGLYDTENGGFLPYPAGRPAGDVAHDACHAYLESDGTNWIDTGYHPATNAAIEVDYMLLATDNCTQPRIFGSGSPDNSFAMVHYLNGGHKFAFVRRDNTSASGSIGHNTSTDLPADAYVRHTFTLDSFAGTATFTTGGETVYSKALTTTPVKETSSLPLYIFNSSDWNTMMSVLRLHRLRIYESGVLAREYLPYKSGSVCGLYETQTKQVLTPAAGNAFTIGGMGVAGETDLFAVRPQDGRATMSRPAVLTAFAPGATAYRWFEGEEELVGETAADLTVAWRPPAGTRLYRVIPVFSVAGRTVEGAAASAAVEHVSEGTVLMLR